MHQEATLKCRNFCYQAKIWHNSELPPILALHGWLDNAGSFDCIAPFLSNYRLVAVDLPGHGLSPHKSGGARYHYVDYINDVYDIMEHFKWDKITLMGHSMGAGISTLFSGAFPELIENLILIEGIGPLVSEPANSPDNLKKSVLQFKSLNVKKPTTYSSREQAEKVRQKAGDISLEAVRILGIRGIKKTEKGFQWNSDARLKCKSPIQFTESHVEYFLKNISARTLLIRGSNSKLESLIPCNQRIPFIKNIEIATLNGNHHLHMDCSDEVGQVITGFLR